MKKTLSFPDNPSVETGDFTIPSNYVFYELSTKEVNLGKNPINSRGFWHKVCSQISEELQFRAIILGSKHNLPKEKKLRSARPRCHLDWGAKINR